MNKLIVLFFFIFPLLSCTNKYESCDKSDYRCLQKLMNNHVIKKMSYWEKFHNVPINERVFVAPKEVIQYIDLDNQKNGFQNKPFAPKVTKDFMKDIKSAIDEIPSTVKTLLDKKFIGVFLVNDLGGTGYTDRIFNEKGEAVASFVVLDYRVLQKRSANEWATWKESTPFKSDPTYSIEAIIQPKESDNRKYAIQYILLHELGHVISVNKNFHPPWGLPPSHIQNIEKYKFFNESWRVEDNNYISKFDSTTMPKRKRVIYYFGAQLESNQMQQIYSGLENTNFPTLYAATKPGEDWAESFVTYIHNVLMKKPFLIKLKKKDKVIKEFKLCWGTPRCAKKEATLANLFLK